MSNILNELIELGQGPIRSLDCVIAIELKEFPSEEIILERAKLALKIFPATASLPLTLKTYESLTDFTNGKLKHPERLCLGVIEENNHKYLALKMSHVLGDAISMLMWLKVIVTGETSSEPLKLKSFPSKKDTPYRKLVTSNAWMGKVDQDERRHILKLTLSHPKKIQNHSINDILLLSLLRSLKVKHKAIWLPVNVREKFWSGFGNGLSRMRIYPLENASLVDELNFIRKQKSENMKNGEVALPPQDLDLNSPLKKNLFKLWLNRPWADWGSLSLSHLEDRENHWPEIKSLWGVTNIIEKHQGGLFAWTHGTETFLTFTLDWNVPLFEGRNLLEDIQKNFEEIYHELAQ